MSNHWRQPRKRAAFSALDIAMIAAAIAAIVFLALRLLLLTVAP